MNTETPNNNKFKAISSSLRPLLFIIRNNNEENHHTKHPHMQTEQERCLIDESE